MNFLKYLSHLFLRVYPGSGTENSSLLPEQLSDFKNRYIEILSNSSVSKDSSIGDYTYIGTNSHITRAVIGNYCSIANNVTIGSGEHLLDTISTSSLFYDPEEAYALLTEKDCIIGNDVWIGVDCIIRRGVQIGNGAVIGANSFVNKNVPAFAVVAGSPAKVLKYRYSPSQIVLLENSEWWKLPLSEAKIKMKDLTQLLHESK